MGVIALDAGLIKILFNYIMFDCLHYWICSVWNRQIRLWRLMFIGLYYWNFSSPCLYCYVCGLKTWYNVVFSCFTPFFFVFVFYGKVRNLYYTLWKILYCCVYAWRWFLVLKNLFYSVWCSVICTNDWDLYLNYLLNYNYYEN